MSKSKLAAILSLVVLSFSYRTTHADELKFYPMKSFSVKGEYQGAQTGTFAEHVDRYGNIRVEINDMTMNMMGMSIKTRERIIYEGDTITRVDLEKRTATQAKNPMYESIASNVKREGGVKTGESFIRSMGGNPTGKQGEYAGETCDFWSVPSMGTELCITADAITLYSRSNMAGVEAVRVAKEIKRGDPGPKEVYQVPSDVLVSKPTLPATESGEPVEGMPPNIQKMLEGVMK